MPKIRRYNGPLKSDRKREEVKSMIIAPRYALKVPPTRPSGLGIANDTNGKTARSLACLPADDR